MTPESSLFSVYVYNHSGNSRLGEERWELTNRTEHRPQPRRYRQYSWSQHRCRLALIAVGETMSEFEETVPISFFGWSVTSLLQQQKHKVVIERVSEYVRLNFIRQIDIANPGEGAIDWSQSQIISSLERGMRRKERSLQLSGISIRREQTWRNDMMGIIK